MLTLSSQCKLVESSSNFALSNQFILEFPLLSVTKANQQFILESHQFIITIHLKSTMFSLKLCPPKAFVWNIKILNLVVSFDQLQHMQEEAKHPFYCSRIQIYPFAGMVKVYESQSMRFLPCSRNHFLHFSKEN